MANVTTRGGEVIAVFVATAKNLCDIKEGKMLLATEVRFGASKARKSLAGSSTTLHPRSFLAKPATFLGTQEWPRARRIM